MTVDTPEGWREIGRISRNSSVYYFYYLEFGNGARLAGSRFLILTVNGVGLRTLINVRKGDYVIAKKGKYKIMKKIFIRDTVPMYFLEVYSKGNEFYLANGILISYRENL